MSTSDKGRFLCFFWSERKDSHSNHPLELDSRKHITLHYQHFKRHLHLKWPVVHQQLHVIRNTAHRPSTQASYTASQVRPKRKISCAAAQIAATLIISFPRWRHMSLTSYPYIHTYDKIIGHHLRRFFNECEHHKRHFFLRTGFEFEDVETLWIKPVIKPCTGMHFPNQLY